MLTRLITLFSLLIALVAEADIRYYEADSVGVVPPGIAAVEARAANKSGAWSLCWPGAEISVDASVNNFVDGVDEAKATIRCGKKEARVKGFECFGKPNSIAVEWTADGRAHILGGADLLYPIMDLDSLPKPQDYIKVTGAKHVVDIIVETDPDDFARLMTEYNAEELADAKKWRYLDRENDPKVALLGGQYVLAQIGTDLVYMSGAKTNASQWRPGMLKGQMSPTGYVAYYRIQWYDATGRMLHDDSFVQFNDADSTMTITFPALQASLRFTSLIESGVAVGGE